MNAKNDRQRIFEGPTPAQHADEESRAKRFGLCRRCGAIKDICNGNPCYLDRQTKPQKGAK